MNNSLQLYVAVMIAVATVISMLLASPAPLVIVLVVLAVTALFHVLWNDTVPGIFGLRRITFWESFRLLLLAWILFGGVFFRFAVR